MYRSWMIWCWVAVAGVLLGGCRQPELNPTPPAGEGEVLSDYVQLTHGFNRAGEAYFSPDMKWIIFQASPEKGDENYGMYLAQLKWEGDRIAAIGAPIHISPDGSWNSCGFFSPDGNSLIFSSTRKPHKKPPTTQPGYSWEKPAEAEIYRADGWRGAIAALAPGARVDLAKYALTHNDAHDAECGFSPDGKWIAYTSGVSGDMEIWAMRSDGSHQVQLTHSPGYDGGPFVSPDGKRIVYRSDRHNNGRLQVFVADLKFNGAGDIVGEENERQLTDNPAVNFGPFWHPDGHHLIWGTSLHGMDNFELYLMRDDGSHKTRITFTPGGDVLPVFSPDGKYLMWTSRRAADRTSQIWVAKFKMPKGS